MAWGVFYHHLHRLRADRLVTIAVGRGRMRCLFPWGHGTEKPKARHGKTRRIVARAILDLQPIASIADIQTKTSLPRRLIRYHLNILAEEGLLEGTPTTGYQALPSLSRLLKE